MKTATVLFWLWLAYSGLLKWFPPGSYLIVAAAAATTEIDDLPSYVTTSPGETTDNPSYDYNTENIDQDTTTAKVGRNYGSRIRGINSLPYGNSVNAVNGSVGAPPPPFLRPRPTPSVISFNPTNYNRVLKRRKNSTALDGSPYRTRTTAATPLKTNAFFNNYYTVNRTRVVQEETVGEPETVIVPSSPNNNVNVNNNNNNSRSSNQKINVRKRPRPITINDSAAAVETTTVLPPIITTIEPEENTIEPETNSVIKNADPAIQNNNHNNNLTTTTTSPPNDAANASSVVILPSSNNKNNGTENNILKLAKPEPNVLQLSPTKAGDAVHSVTSLTAEPVSNVPVFEYNPSVTVKDGVYRFHYSEPTYTSKRVHKEDFGISHVTYGTDSEDDEYEGTGLETTTYAPENDEKTTPIPYHIAIDGSEEEFTSSLPPAYRDYIAQEDIHPRIPSGENPQEKPQNVVTVTVTHTVVTESSSSSHHHNAKTNEVTGSPASEESNAVKKEGASSQQNAQANNNNMIHATPALPDFQPATRNESVVIIHTHYSSPVADTKVEVTHQEHENSSSSESEEIKPSAASPPEVPVQSGNVTSKVVTSVFYTKQELPGYTTSSYSFTETTSYSYGHPDDHHHDDHDEDDPHDHHHQQQHDHNQDGHASEHAGNSVEKQPQQLQPTTTSFWDSLGKQSIELMKSKIGLNASSSSAEDQDSGFSTPEAETEIPPSKFHTTPIPNYEDHSEDNEIDDGNTTREVEEGKVRVHPGPGIVYDEQDTELPSVPVYIQVLIDMPARLFCSRISIFKNMVASVYAPQVGVTPEQVIVVNELNCSNITAHYNHSHHGNSTNQTNLLNEASIKFATTTATVLRTISSSTARSVIPPKRTNPVREKRHDHHSVHHYGDDGNNITDHIHSINETEIAGPAARGPAITTALYPVFFYLNDKNGTYDRSLTESFIHYWNTSKAANTMFFDKIKKIEMITPTQGIIGEATSNENTGIIAAITIAGIAAVSLFLLGILLLVMRHRQAQSKFAKRCTPVSLDDYSLDNISVYNSFRRKQRNRASKRSYTNAGFDDPNAPSRPCNAAALTAIIAEPGKIEEEFLDLPTATPTLDDIPAGAETKNRYANVIPIPDTRVLLTFQEDVPNSDYINANFVRGPMGTSKGYIITQGPLDETIVDFWRMVWEQQIRVIMMLTDFSEAGISKCAEYYPRSETVDSSQLHGDFQITLEKRDITDNCITSYLVIKDMERNLRRDVIHLWYHSWPEKGVPNNPKSTIDFLLKSRKFTKEPTPVLVHCSPGTGRSGSLVACDICMREWDTQHSVNIPRTVMKIRQDRAGAVQTKEQYMHIYQVLQSYASRLTVNSVDPV